MSPIKKIYIKKFSHYEGFVRYESALIFYTFFSALLVSILPYTPLTDVICMFGIVTAVLFNYEYFVYNRHASQSKDIGHSD